MTSSTETKTPPVAFERDIEDRTLTLPQLTEDEIEKGLMAFERVIQLRDEIAAERAGVPFPESWPLIREARDER